MTVEHVWIGACLAAATSGGTLLGLVAGWVLRGREERRIRSELAAESRARAAAARSAGPVSDSAVTTVVDAAALLRQRAE